LRCGKRGCSDKNCLLIAMDSRGAIRNRGYYAQATGYDKLR
jgi:hypothetical protein